MIVGDDRFRRLEEEFNQFCPFEALGMVRAEIRHGNFLSYMMDPQRPHGLGARILRAFLFAAARHADEVGGDLMDLRPLDVHLLDLTNAEIRREWRNIDLVIILESSKILIAIELKIDASQSNSQLIRYRETVESAWPENDGWRHLFVFLTKLEEQPLDEDFWLPLPLRLFVDEMDRVIALGGKNSGVAEMLSSYLQMLRRHHLTDERLEEIARKLWAQHGEALDFLAEHRPDAIGNVLSALREKSAEIASSIGLGDATFITDVPSSNALRFAVKEWDELPGFRTAKWTDSKRLILFEIKRYGSNGITAFLYLGPGETEDREIYRGHLKEKRLHKRNSRAGTEWMCLAKRDLFKVKWAEEIDSENGISSSIIQFKRFVKECFTHFDPILRKLPDMPPDAQRANG